MRNKTKFLLISALSLCTLSAGVTAVMASAETETPNELNLTFAGASIRYAEEGKQDGIRFAVQMDAQDWNDFSEQIEKTYVKINNGTKTGGEIETSDNWYPVNEAGDYATENVVAYRSVVVLYGNFDATMDFTVQAFAKFFDATEEVASAVSAPRSMSYVAKEEVKKDSSKLDAVKEYMYYTVTFDVDGEKTSQTAQYGTPVSALEAYLEEVNTEKDGYLFTGWTIGEYTLEQAIAGGAILTEDIEVKANWKKNSATLAIDPMAGITSTATISNMAFPHYVGVGTDVAKSVSFDAGTTVATVTMDSALVSYVKNAYEEIEIRVGIYDDGCGMIFKANGETSTLTGNGVRAFRFNTENWNGTFTMEAVHKDWAVNYKIRLASVTGYGAKETIAVSTYEAEAIVGTEYTIPTANVTFAEEVVESNTVAATATFNDDVVDITSGKFTATEAGTLVVTYTYGEMTATATVVFNLKRTIVAEEGMEYVENSLTDWKVPYWGGHDFGKYANTTVKALKLIGDGSAKFNLQFSKAFVEELKKYSEVEMIIVFEGQEGSQISFSANGASTGSKGNGRYTLRFLTENWDGIIGCSPLNPSWTVYYNVYVSTITGLGVAKEKLVVNNAMTNVTNTTVAWTVPSWAQYNEYKGNAVQAYKISPDANDATYYVSFKSEFVETLKKYKTVTLTIVFEGQEGAPITFSANGVSTSAAANGIKTLTFATEGWDGRIALSPVNPTWYCYYYTYFAVIVAE